MKFLLRPICWIRREHRYEDPNVRIFKSSFDRCKVCGKPVRIVMVLPKELIEADTINHIP